MESFKLNTINLLPDAQSFAGMVLIRKNKHVDQLLRDARVRLRRQQILNKIINAKNEDISPQKKFPIIRSHRQQQTKLNKISNKSVEPNYINKSKDADVHQPDPTIKATNSNGNMDAVSKQLPPSEVSLNFNVKLSKSTMIIRREPNLIESQETTSKVYESEDISMMSGSTVSSHLSELSEPFGVGSEEIRPFPNIHIDISPSKKSSSVIYVKSTDNIRKEYSKPKRIARDTLYQSESDEDDIHSDPKLLLIKNRDVIVVNNKLILKIDDEDEIGDGESSLASVSILTGDSREYKTKDMDNDMNTKYNDDVEDIYVSPPDVATEYLWEFEFDMTRKFYDSNYFDFGGVKWRITLSKPMFHNHYSLMISPFNKSVNVKMMCMFKLVGLLRPDYVKCSKENLSFTENTTRYRGCENFIGDEIVNYLDNEDRLTISVYLCSFLSNGHLIGYDRHVYEYAEDSDMFSVSDNTVA